MRLGVREVVFLMVLLVVPVASYFYVFKPRNVEIKQAQEEIKIKQARLDKLREVTEQIEDIGLAIDQGRAAIELVEFSNGSANPDLTPRTVEVVVSDDTAVDSATATSTITAT